MATSLITIGMKTKSYADKQIAGRGTIGDRMEKAFQETLPGMLAEIKKKYLTTHSSDSLQKRKGNIYRNTNYSISRTGKDNVTGKINIGEGVPYTGMHVGKSGTTFATSGGKPFVIPFTWNRNKDGSWRAPYIPGQLRNAPGLFRGSRKHNLNPDILYQRYKTRGPKPMFILKRQIKVPNRVDMDEIQVDVRARLSMAMERAFEGYDFGYLRMSQK